MGHCENCCCGSNLAGALVSGYHPTNFSHFFGLQGSPDLFCQFFTASKETSIFLGRTSAAICGFLEIGAPPCHPLKKKIHHKPSILGYPHLRKSPCPKSAVKVSSYSWRFKSDTASSPDRPALKMGSKSKGVPDFWAPEHQIIHDIFH